MTVIDLLNDNTNCAELTQFALEVMKTEGVFAQLADVCETQISRISTFTTVTDVIAAAVAIHHHTSPLPAQSNSHSNALQSAEPSADDSTTCNMLSVMESEFIEARFLYLTMLELIS
jgi:menaquinone-dependent protoporphyrinogen IX oxidase